MTDEAGPEGRNEGDETESAYGPQIARINERLRRIEAALMNLPRDFGRELP